ncbi:hypothetical protein LEN26_016170 [Aphanomyces euteiches]|nr:hypothetical protein LEN26_016170 [Aphanomyces euteiches]
MFPTATAIATRECTSNVYLPMSDGKLIFIPKGTTVIVSLVAQHHNPKYGSQSDEFIPECFLEGRAIYQADKVSRNGHGDMFAYMPFSTGLKNCSGHAPLRWRNSKWSCGTPVFIPSD